METASKEGTAKVPSHTVMDEEATDNKSPVMGNYIRHKGYSGTLFNDISCGRYITAESITEACDLDINCKGFSFDPHAIVNGYWCLKIVGMKGEPCEDGVWYEKKRTS